MPIPGPPGPPGAQGVPGPPGANGNSILSDVIPPTAVVGQVSDLFVDLVTSQLYKKTGPVTWAPEFALIGPAGTAATVAVGVTTTLAPATPAAVNNTGTAQAAVFNFGIPQGIQGIQGIQGPPGSAATASVWSTFPATQDVDIGNFQLDNVTAINAPVGLYVTAPTGDITLDVQGPNPAAVVVKGGPLDLSGNDLDNLGSLSTSGVANVVDFGGVLDPLFRFTATSSEVTINHLNPLTQMLVRGQGDVRVESINGDLNLIGDDVNIATTGASNVLNITAVGGIQNTAGGFFNVSAGGGMGIQAGALISITTPGQINIGSGNVLGATTSIEKVDFLDSVISKITAPGTADLQIQNVASVSNSAAPVALSGTGVNITSIGPGDVNILTQAGITPLVSVSNLTGVMSTTFLPQCAVVPTLGPELTNKTFVDTKIPGNADFTMTNNLAAPAASAASNGPFLYIPSFAGPPTGTPTVIPGATPLYMDISGGADLYAYVAGAWVAV
jgi:hypothetical protein